MISDEELDGIIADHHEFFPDRTLEQIARGYVQIAQLARRDGDDVSAARYDSVAAALYERLTREKERS